MAEKHVVIEFTDGSIIHVRADHWQVNDGVLNVWEDYRAERGQYFPICNIKSWYWGNR
jgi:hypothetical protein